MAATGPLKLPKHLQSVDSRSSPDTAADVVDAVAPVKPAAVAEDETLSAVWDEVVPALDATGLVTRADAPSIELALRHFQAARAASDELLGGPAMLWDEKNQRHMKNPAEVVFRSESLAFLEYAKQLGMTFAGRARTRLAQSDDGDANPYIAATG